ncbi:S24 family peptidase [Pedobacter sp. L105]|uniref:S24 family peptidase n=1 Tax=Pedobacter sp. L105 TaxID=1641871 RepID=UPI0020B15DB7|nr:S24 family peptidase [Pedobacter sp. L105]
MTLQEFYSPIAKHVNNFSPIENGARKIGKRLSEDVIQYYHINEVWLATGTGNIYTEKELRTYHEPDNYEIAEGVPFININPTDLSSGEFNLLREKPEYYVNFRPFNDCDAYLPIYGDSMYPKYASGEIIAVREVANKDIIQWGEAYLVIADEYANNITTVKLLFEHNLDSKIILRVSNPNYKGDTILDKDAIKRLFIVKGKITRNQL